MRFWRSASGRYSHACLNVTNKSTLSLHIAAYENSNEAFASDFSVDENIGGLKKEKLGSIKTSKHCFTDRLMNPFEFPRQQNENQRNKPENMQFKTSQRLLGSQMPPGAGTSEMNDTQLREELSTFGVNVGPINDSTRETYTRLLAKKKGGGSPSRSSSRKSYSPARTATPKTKTPPTRRNVSPPPIERPVPISPPRRTPPSTRRASPPSRRESPPAITRQPPPSVSPPRPVRQVSPTRVSPPKPIRQPPPQPKRVSPRPFHQSSTSQYSRPADPITPDYPLSRSTAAYNRIDFDNSVPDEDDDDHMEFSKYIPRSNYSKRPQNTSISSSVLNNTKKKVAAAVRTSKGFQINPTFCLGGALMCLVLGYILTPQTFHSGVTATSDLFNSVIMVGFKYAIAPILAVGFLFALGGALYYGFQALSKKRAIHEEKKRKLIKDILKAVCNAPTHGIPVKQLRDRMVPAYKRTKDELILWNECEDFVKTYETRVRAEERANHNGDEIVEHFVWVGSTLNQDLEDE